MFLLGSEDPTSDGEGFEDDGGMSFANLKRKSTQASIQDGIAPGEQAATICVDIVENYALAPIAPGRPARKRTSTSTT